MIDTRANTGKAAFAAALAAVVVGVCVLAGWLFDLEFLKRIAPGLVAMNPATAVAFILAGASLALFLQSPCEAGVCASPSGAPLLTPQGEPQGRDQKSRALILTARLCALVVTLIGLAKLVCIMFGWDLGVDRWLFSSKLADSLRFPNRMAPNTAFNFLLLGGALLFVDVKNRSVRFCVEFSVVLVGSGSLLAVMAYAYHIQSFYIGAFIPMALHTAITFSVLTVAFLLSHTDSGLLAVFAGDSAGGKVARRLLPAAVLVPAMLGWLTLQGEKAGIYDDVFGHALFAAGNILVFTFLVCWSAKRLFRADLVRIKAEEEMRESEERFSGAFEHAPIGKALVSPDGRWLKVNRALCDLVGYSEAGLLTRTFQDITHPEDLEVDLENVRRLLAGEIRSYQMEKRYVHARGHLVTVLLHVSLVRDGQGQPRYFISQIQDITEHKRAEEALCESKQIIEGILNAMPAGVFWKDQNLVFMGGNSVFARDAGFADPKDIIGKDDYQMVWRAQAELYRGDDRKVIESGCVKLLIEEPHTTPEGNTLTLLTSKIPLRNSKGEINGVLGTYLDITERKRVEEQLRVQATALDAAANAIVITDQNGTIQSVNPAFTALTGYTAQEAVGQNPRVLKAGNHDEAFYRNLWQTISSGRVWSGELINRRKDGSLYDEEMTITPLRNADGMIVRYIAIKQDITERKRVEAALVEANALLETLLQTTTDGIYFKDMQSRFVHFSRSMLVFFHLTHPDELKGRTDFDFFLDEHARPAFEGEQEIIRTGKSILNLEEKETHRDGRITCVLTSKMPWRDQAGNVIGTIGISRDITERKQIEAQLFQSQKMETVGKLAGGIAHEFNNIMTAIIGQSELLLSELPAGNPLSENATEITKAANRAATLTRQLLAYGRRQFLRPESLDLNQVLAGMEGTICLLMSGDVDVRIIPAEGLHTVKADAGQIEQVIVNMTINAREAMPKGGKLTVEAGNVSLTQESVGRYPELKPGDYVMLTITDTGTGMSAEVQARAFEPFFTTKGVGEGTGLGLSTCYGIVKQSGGHISVSTEPGRGTTFKIYLPQVEAQTKIPIQRLDAPDLPHGTETILLAEDDPALREMVAGFLRRLGYTVLAAADGIKALELKQERSNGPIDLLLTDVVMPRMSGKELAYHVRELDPNIRILFTSAFPEHATVDPGGWDQNVAPLKKPFTPAALARRIREVLDQPMAPMPEPAPKSIFLSKLSDAVKPPGS